MREFNLSIIKIQSKEIGTQIEWALYVLIGKRVNRFCQELVKTLRFGFHCNVKPVFP